MRHIDYIILIILAIIALSGCASFDGTYMGSNEPVTRMECEMQYSEATKTAVTWRKVLACRHLPETLW